MTVRELIERLQAFPQDAMVVTDGYEGGVEAPVSLQLVRLKLDVRQRKEWFYGRHEIAAEGLEAVYIEAPRDNADSRWS